jgi:hypothetical protein
MRNEGAAGQRPIGHHPSVWWLNVVGLVAFGVVLALGFVALRRGEVHGRRSTFVAILGAGVVLLAVVAVALASTA